MTWTMVLFDNLLSDMSNSDTLFIVDDLWCSVSSRRVMPRHSQRAHHLRFGVYAANAVDPLVNIDVVLDAIFVQPANVRAPKYQRVPAAVILDDSTERKRKAWR